MLSLAALICLILAGVAAPVSLLLAAVPAVAGMGFAVAAFNRPGDMEWLLGLFLLAGLGWFLVQIGALIGLWGL